MAKPAVAAAGTDAVPKKSNMKLIVLVLVVVMLLSGGAGAFLMMKAKKKPKTEAAEESHEAEKHGPPVFTQLEPFVVNLNDAGSERYLQVGIAFEVKDAKISELVKAYTPILRSRILLVLTSKEVKDVGTIEGKQKVMDELLDMARETIAGPTKDKGIVDVHFSSFVIQ
ncbi:MAG: flagellar basal body-associated protein FliL [Burkholderiaceae bacterium]|jgi:flagellar FliL protein